MVGASLWAEQHISAKASSFFAFPRYTDDDRYNTNSASNLLNKWFKINFYDDIVIHGFRHATRDHLRAGRCPSAMISQIGGWATAGIGVSYGGDYPSYPLGGVGDFVNFGIIYEKDDRVETGVLVA